MGTSTSAFRLTARDRQQLDRLADELLLSRTDVLRLGLKELRQNPSLRREIQAQQLASRFLSRLSAGYGTDAHITLEVSSNQLETNAHIDDAPIDLAELGVLVRREDNFTFIDLVAPLERIVIRNAHWIETDDDHRIVRFPLSSVDLYQYFSPTDEPRSHRLDDGRTVIAVPQDDGVVRQIVLDAAGNARPLPRRQQVEQLSENATDPPPAR